MVNEKIECPNCRSGSHVKKGKSSNKQFQKLQCKNCLRNFRIEVSIYDKQMTLPTIETRIVKYPNGGYSVCRVSYTETSIQTKWINCLLILTPKTKTYKETIKNIRSDKDINIDQPKPMQLNDYVPETLKNDLKKLFGNQEAHAWKNIINEMVK